MAQAIQDKFTKDVKRFSRGVKQAPFFSALENIYAKRISRIRFYF